MIWIAAASGNVFAYLWADEAPGYFQGPQWAKALCPRGRGLGLDGLFLLERPRPGEPWGMEHWEPDGTHTFCSNGTRAAAALLPPSFRGEVEARVSGEQVRIRVEEAGVGLRLPEGKGYGLVESPLSLDHPHALGWTGTPHLVIEVPDVERIHLPSFAPPLRFHSDLPEGANVSILQRLDSGHAKIRSWERGVEGETLCCGQGCAVAGAWLAQRTGVHRWEFQPAGEDPVRVELQELHAGEWVGLWLSGPVHCIGRFEPDSTLILELG